MASLSSRIFLRLYIAVICLLVWTGARSQVNWTSADSLFGVLPEGVHVYHTTDSLDGRPFRAFYVSVPLKTYASRIGTRSGGGRLLTPFQYYEREQKPWLVVNGTFFALPAVNLNVMINEGQLLSHNIYSVRGRGRDSLLYRYPFRSAIGFYRNGRADVAWVYTDSLKSSARATQVHPGKRMGPSAKPEISLLTSTYTRKEESGHRHAVSRSRFRRWKVQDAIGGGPALVEDGYVHVYSEEEQMFAGREKDLHPRTAAGYTADGRLLILVVQGRSPQSAGATLFQLATMLVELGCTEALNLDGGGSSCLLLNGRETITPSDKQGQRAVPGVLIIQ